MKKAKLKGRKPSNKIQKERDYKNCKISYSVFDYDIGSSGFSYVTFFTNNSFVGTCLVLRDPAKNIKEAEEKIIRDSKKWIDLQLKPIQKKLK